MHTAEDDRAAVAIRRRHLTELIAVAAKVAVCNHFVLLVVVAEDQELRPEIFAMAREKSWTLWELHRERASLEDVFRNLTSEGEEVDS